MRKQYDDKISEKKIQYQNLMNHVRQELAQLKLTQGQDRKMKKSDPFYKDFE